MSIDLEAAARLMPNRRLTHAESLLIAEVQASKILRLANVKSPPVPVVDLVVGAGIEIIYDPSVDEIGGVFRRGDRWSIRHSCLDDAELQATLAHQLKIILDHPFGDVLYPHQDVMAPGLRRHHVAEYFAVCLTLPEEWIRQLWNSGERNLGQLACQFGVPIGTMVFRLRALGLDGSCVV